MRNFVFIFLALGCVTASYSCRKDSPVQQTHKLNWLSDWTDASSTAKKEGRQMIAMFHTEWCPYCTFLEERIFGQSDVVDKMEKFVLLKLDGDKPVTQPLMDKLGVKGFPTFIVLNPEEKELLRFNDINSADELLKLLSDIESKKVGHTELNTAKKLVEEGKRETAISLYKKAYDVLSAENDPSAEDALAGLLEVSKGDFDSGVRYASELINKFPSSPLVPVYYKKIADLYSSGTIKKHYLLLATKRIEDMANSFDQLDNRAKRIFIDQLVDVSAEAYKDMEKYSDVKKAYLKGAHLCEEIIRHSGGLSNNRHLIGTMTHFYLSAASPEAAIKFLKEAINVLPDYWPVYSNLAKALAAKGAYDKAVVHAARGYELAEEVAKPRVALVWGEVLVASGDYTNAIQVLNKAEADLLTTGAAESGRAAKMLKQIKTRANEYATPLSLE